MKITRAQLKSFINEALEIHRVEEELVGMDPHDAYGSGYLKGKEYHEDNDEIEVDIELKLTIDQIRRLLLREFKYTGHLHRLRHLKEAAVVVKVGQLMLLRR